MDAKMSHSLDRFKVSELKCKSCSTVQGVSDKCKTCGERFAKYFCRKCSLFDNDITKKQFHCDKCGICRIGGSENFKHCDTCKCCVSIHSEHKCQASALENDCAICLRSLFDSREGCVQLPTCGHILHKDCFSELSKHKYQCPLCSKSFCNMWVHDRQLDSEIEATPMPDELKNKIVGILCNDCQKKTEVSYHILGAKCGDCMSYNTRLL